MIPERSTVGAFPLVPSAWSCHSRAAGFVLGFTELQTDCLQQYGEVEDEQLRSWEHIGLFTGKLTPEADRKRLVNPGDMSADIESRVKSYLHTNCAGCHVAAGGGNARMELGFKTAIGEMSVVSQFPQHATFGMIRPRIVAPGEPEQSSHAGPTVTPRTGTDAASRFSSG